MKLAIQDNLIPGKNFKEKVQNAQRYGFEGIEVWGTSLQGRKEEIKKACLDSTIKISTVCAGYRGCLLSSQKEKRDVAVEDIKQLLAIGADLGAVGLIVVPIFSPPQLPDLSPWKRTEDIEKDLLVELLGRIGEKAEKVGCLCLLEPLNRYETHLINTVEEAIQIAKRVNSPGIKVMADFFHMNIEEARIDKAIEGGKNFICNVHLADSNRLLPGCGHTDFKAGFTALKKIGYDKYMALECKVPAPEKQLPECIKYLKKCMA